MSYEEPTDRELIELAARAYFGANFRGEVRQTTPGGFWEALTEGQSPDDLLGFQRFDPLQFNDDAFMLFVKLRMGIDLNRYDRLCRVIVYEPYPLAMDQVREIVDISIEKDAEAKVRRAITMAAGALSPKE